MTKKQLMKAMCLTKEQNDAIAELNAAFSKVNSLGVDFIYDHCIYKLVAFNATSVDVEPMENLDDDDVCIDFERRIADYDDESDNWFCEVGPETYYHEECYDRMAIVPKECNN